MNRKSGALILGICLALTLFLFTSWAAAQPKEGENVGNLKFAAPISPDDSKYLGLAQAGPFSLKDIKAQYVILDFFSTTCSHCFHQAPTLNALYSLVAQNPKLKDKLKFIGVGAHDNPFKLQYWKQNFKVPFPLIPDVEGAMFKSLKMPGTPIMLVVDKDGKVVYTHLGAIESADGTLKEILGKIKL
ncbi:MAG: TlpA disulfide reductase family protein [Thermodesulfobacteriota bacterium]